MIDFIVADRLDGLKRRREGFHVGTMEDYLQLPADSDDENVVHSESGGPGGNKKRVCIIIVIPHPRGGVCI